MTGNEGGVSVERSGFEAYETGIETLLGEYHRSVADGHRDYLARHAPEYEFSPAAYVRDETETDLAYLGANDDRRPLVVAVDGDDVVGCVYLYELTDDEAEIKRLYVREAYRGRGVGRRLLERLIEVAENEGYRSLRLDTAPYMEGAQHLYRQLGFDTYEGGASVTDVPDPLLDDLVFMRRRLDGR
ncbi:GNAT family N-acetyltransferase [Halococcus salsus]|uniref:GNAT family N-acetyltransferase n=1 Tax=Halococcus salsus TaxID=2162894 RepID=UPI00135AD9A4|nr:GNAT family N-acetyltransferase [Halococcus salsus]